MAKNKKLPQFEDIRGLYKGYKDPKPEPYITIKELRKICKELGQMNPHTLIPDDIFVRVNRLLQAATKLAKGRK